MARAKPQEPARAADADVLLLAARASASGGCRGSAEGEGPPKTGASPRPGVVTPGLLSLGTDVPLTPSDIGSFSARTPSLRRRSSAFAESAAAASGRQRGGSSLGYCSPRCESAAAASRLSPRPAPESASAAAAATVAFAVPSRPSTSMGTTAMGESRAFGLRHPKAPELLVVPPWAPERANADNPTRTQVVEKQLAFRQRIEEQKDDKKTWAVKTKEELESRWPAANQAISTSLATSTHRWGKDASFPGIEKQLMQEAYKTVAQRKLNEKEVRKSEIRDSERMRVKIHQQMLEASKAHEVARKREGEAYRAEWDAQAEAKRRAQEEERSARLTAEKQEVEFIKYGMLPDRRVRKPVQRSRW